MDVMNPAWEEWANTWGDRLQKRIKARNWARLYQRYGEEIGVPENEFKSFCLWLRDEWIPRQDSPVVATAPAHQPKATPKPEVTLHWEEHDKPYWYDDNRDLYVVHLPSRKHPLAIKGDKWTAIREAYSNWSGSPVSVNELARKFGLARRTVVELLRCMGMTHDSSPWPDEDLATENEDSLVDDLLRRKEERVLVKAERENWNKIKTDADKWRNFDREVVGHLVANLPKASRVTKLVLPEMDRKFVAVVSPTDFHHGKYADEFEVGEEDNRKLQRMRLVQSTQQVLADVVRHGRPERIVFGIGSDFFNIDNAQGTTTEGTPQDMDGNPAEMLLTGCQLMVEYVDLLRQVAPVSAVLMSGNHDRLLGTALLLYLAAWYRDCPDVAISQKSAANRQYVEYGQNLLCFHHADLVQKTSDLARLAAVERPREWGRCQYKMAFTGHLHSLKMEEDRGFTRFQLPSLSGADRWHAEHGYVGSRRQLAAVLVDRTEGVFGTLYAAGD